MKAIPPIIRSSWPILFSLAIWCSGIQTTAALGAQTENGRAEPLPKELEGVGITEKLDAQVPLELSFKNEEGREVSLKSFFKGNRPVVLVLGYYRCPMLCNLLLNGMVEGMKELKMTPGKDFEVVMVSIDPLETPNLAKLKKQNYLQDYGRPETAAGWHFLVGKQSAIAALTDAVGFGYRHVRERNEFAHTAALFVLTPDGRLSRILYGILFEPSTLKLALVEASEGRIGSALDRIVLYCFHYDPSSGTYSPIVWRIMQVAAGATVLALAIALPAAWFGSGRKRKSRKAAG